ncbi:MFS transporter [Nonomuraea sp. NPDC050556]|uniref:MFS transporter n=1 Tax=Nonomuraea sp. NPDC050556 TaxID=3364369 RepID=UPI0037A4B424
MTLLQDRPVRVAPPAGRASGAHRRVGRAVRTSVLIALGCGAMALAMADTMAATMAVPLLEHVPVGRGVPIGDLQWVASASAIAYGAVLAVAGRLADTLGRRRVLLFGMFVFGLGAAAATVAPSLTILLAGRAVQGVGAGAIIPSSLALLLTHIPAKRRAAAIGAWSASSGLGGIALHSGGGWLAAAYGPQTLFAPAAIGAGLLFLLAFLAPADRPSGPYRAPDLLGTLTLMAGLGALVLVISKGQEWGWTSAPTGGLALAILGLISISVLRSMTHPAPSVDLMLWRTPAFALAAVIALIYGIVSLALLATGPFLLQSWGIAPAGVGLLLVPLSVGVLVSSLISGPLVRRFGSRPVVYVGVVVVVLTAIGELQLGLGDHPDLIAWVLACTATGLGLGAISTGASAAATLTAGTERYASAAGASMTMRQIGSALGVGGGIALLRHPVLPGSLPAHASVLALIVCGVVLAGLLALVLRTPVQRARREAAWSISPDELMMLRRHVVELRATLLQVRADTDDELAHLERAGQPRRHRPSGVFPTSREEFV